MPKTTHTSIRKNIKKISRTTRGKYAKEYIGKYEEEHTAEYKEQQKEKYRRAKNSMKNRKYYE